MEKSLIERSIALHGSALGKLVAEEQGDLSTDVENLPVAEPATKGQVLQKQSRLGISTELKSNVKRPTLHQQVGTGPQASYKMQQFIAKKADMLFKKREDPEIITSTTMQQSEQADFYAILPPMEQLMAVPPDNSRQRLFHLLQMGDVVIGRIITLKEFGLFVQLVAVCRDSARFIESLEVIALLPAAELSDRYSKAVKVDDFHVGEYVRGIITKLNPDEQKIILTLKAQPETPQEIILGMISEAELPIHYRRSLALEDTQESYEQMLSNTVGFDNPNNVAYLTNTLRIDEKKPPSLMRGLQRGSFPENEFAEALRKWQTGKLAMESVAKGVGHFKAGKHLEAMQHLNKALEIDKESVEALVARGALYANTGSLSKALQDFGEALRINPNHRNANKYMCQTLLERGKELEDSKKYSKARDCYQSALDIQPEWLDAQLCLQKLNERKPPQPRSPSITPSSPPSQMSAKALLKMVEQDDSQSDREEGSSKKRRKSYEKKGKELSGKSRRYSRSRSRSRARSREPNRDEDHQRGRSSKRQDFVAVDRGREGKRRVSKEVEDDKQKRMISGDSLSPDKTSSHGSKIKAKYKSPSPVKSSDSRKNRKTSTDRHNKSPSKRRRSRGDKSPYGTPSPDRSIDRRKHGKSNIDSSDMSELPKRKEHRPEKSLYRTPSPSRSSERRKHEKSEYHSQDLSPRKLSKIGRSRSLTPSPSRKYRKPSFDDGHDGSQSHKRSKNRRSKSSSRSLSPGSSSDKKKHEKTSIDSTDRSQSQLRKSRSNRSVSHSPSRKHGKSNGGGHDRSHSPIRKSGSIKGKSRSRTPSPSRTSERWEHAKGNIDTKDRSRSPKRKTESKRDKSRSRTPSFDKENTKKKTKKTKEYQELGTKSDKQEDMREKSRQHSQSRETSRSERDGLKTSNLDLNRSRSSSGRRYQSRSRSPSIEEANGKDINKKRKPKKSQISGSDSDDNSKYSAQRRNEEKSRRYSGDQFRSKDKKLQGNENYFKASDTDAYNKSPVRKSEIKRDKSSSRSPSQREKNKGRTDVKTKTYQMSDSESADKKEMSSKSGRKSELMRVSKSEVPLQDKEASESNKSKNSQQSRENEARRKSHSEKSAEDTSVSSKRKPPKPSFSPSNDPDHQLGKMLSKKKDNDKSTSPSLKRKHSKKKKTKKISSPSSTDSEHISVPAKKKATTKKKKRQRYSSSSSSSNDDLDKTKSKSAKKSKKKKKKSKLEYQSPDVVKKIEAHEANTSASKDVLDDLDHTSKQGKSQEHKRTCRDSLSEEPKTYSGTSSHPSLTDGNEIPKAYLRSSSRQSLESHRKEYFSGSDIVADDTASSRKQKKKQKDRIFSPPSTEDSTEKQSGYSKSASLSSATDTIDNAKAYSKSSSRHSLESRQRQHEQESGEEDNVFSRKETYQEEKCQSHPSTKDPTEKQKAKSRSSGHSSIADRPERKKTYSSSSSGQSVESHLKENSHAGGSRKPKDLGKSPSPERQSVAFASSKTSKSPYARAKHLVDGGGDNPCMQSEIASSREGNSKGKVLELTKEQQAMLRKKYRDHEKVRRRSEASRSNEHLRNPTGPEKPPSPDEIHSRVRTPDPADYYAISASASFMDDMSKISSGNQGGLASSYEEFMAKYGMKEEQLKQREHKSPFQEMESVKSETMASTQKVSKPSRWDKKEAVHVPSDVSSDYNVPKQLERRGVRWGGYKNPNVRKVQETISHMSTGKDQATQDIGETKETQANRRTCSSGSYICGEEELRKAQESCVKEKDSTEHDSQHRVFRSHADQEQDKEYTTHPSSKSYQRQGSSYVNEIEDKNIRTERKDYRDNIKERRWHLAEKEQFHEREYTESTSYHYNRSSEQILSKSRRLSHMANVGHYHSFTDQDKATCDSSHRDRSRHEERRMSHSERDRHSLEERPRSQRDHKKCDDGIHCGTDEEDETSEISRRKHDGSGKQKDSKKCDDGIHFGTSDEDEKLEERATSRCDRSSIKERDHKTCNDGIHCGTDDEAEKVNEASICRHDSNKNRQRDYKNPDDGEHYRTDKDEVSSRYIKQANRQNKYKCNDGLHCDTDEENKESFSRNEHNDQTQCETNRTEYKSRSKCDDGIHCGTDDEQDLLYVKDSNNPKISKKKTEITKQACEDGNHCGSEDEDKSKKMLVLTINNTKNIEDNTLGKVKFPNNRAQQILQTAEMVKEKNRPDSQWTDSKLSKCHDGLHCGTDDEEEEMDAVQGGHEEIGKSPVKVPQMILTSKQQHPTSEKNFLKNSVSSKNYSGKVLQKKGTVSLSSRKTKSSQQIQSQHYQKRADGIMSDSDNSSSSSSSRASSSQDRRSSRSSNSSYTTGSSYSSSGSSSQSSQQKKGKHSSRSRSTSSSSSSSHSRSRRRKKKRVELTSSTDNSSSSMSEKFGEKQQRQERPTQKRSVSSSSFSSSSSSTSSQSLQPKHSKQSKTHVKKKRIKRKRRKYPSSSSSKLTTDSSPKQKSSRQANDNDSSDTSGELDTSVYEISVDSIEKYLDSLGHAADSSRNETQTKKRRSSGSSKEDTAEDDHKSRKSKELKGKKAKKNERRRERKRQYRQKASSSSQSPDDKDLMPGSYRRKGKTPDESLKKDKTNTIKNTEDISERLQGGEGNVPYQDVDTRHNDSFQDDVHVSQEHQQYTESHQHYQGAEYNEPYSDKYRHYDIHQDRYTYDDRYSHRESTNSDRYYDSRQEDVFQDYSSRRSGHDISSDRYRDRHQDSPRERYDRSKERYHRSFRNRDESRYSHRHREHRHRQQNYVPVEIKESNPFFSLATTEKSELLEKLYEQSVGELDIGRGGQKRQGNHRMWWVEDE